MSKVTDTDLAWSPPLCFKTYISACFLTAPAITLFPMPVGLNHH
ncbi:Uncharacterised protein [Klebsiella pneumoniae]|nr:Uncharacterised protein [Klebsiella pneumoniae]